MESSCSSAWIKERVQVELGTALPFSVSLVISLVLSTSDHLFSESRRSLKVGAEALIFEDISINEVLFHLKELIAAHSVDIATLQLLFEDLGN